MTVDYAYDSLSRVLMEKQNGHEVRVTLDDAGNRTLLVYPSGVKVGQRFDALDRPSAVFRVGAGGAEEGLDESPPAESDWSSTS